MAAADLSVYERPDGAGLCRLDVTIEELTDTTAGIEAIERCVRAIPGVVEARLNVTSQRLACAWREGTTGAGAVIEALAGLGYTARPFAPRAADDAEAAHARWLVRCLAVAGFAAMNVMLLSVSVWSGNVSDITVETRDFFHWVSALIALPAAGYAGQPFFRSAVAALRARRLNMDVPISLGVTLALGMSVVETTAHAEHAYFDSALMLLFFLLCGRWLDHAARRRVRTHAANLAALKAQTAWRLDADGEPQPVAAAGLVPGDHVLIRAGDRVPADGTVLAGACAVDESIVTGESAPRRTAPGALLRAGSIVLDGSLTLRVAVPGTDTFIDEVERLLARASDARSRYVRLADRAAQLYSPLVHATAAATLVGWLVAGASLHDATIIAIAVLIITCPCALALAVPAVQAVATGAFFRAGLLLNAPDAIERLAEADTVLFDKTGTLTVPEPRVANAAALPRDVLERAGRLALGSRHPLALAVAAEARVRRPYDGAEEIAGHGVRAVIDGIEARLGSPTFCGIDVGGAGGDAGGGSAIGFAHGDTRALLTVKQGLRRDAREAADGLRALGMRIAILSGDRPEAVAPVATALGIDRWQGGLTPAAKIAAIAACKAAGGRPLMVGDGLNDAPALAAAHVSISPVSAADLAQAQADAVFLGERLRPVLDAVVLARRARHLMNQNLWLAVLYNAVAVPLAVAGYVTPLIAAIAMSGSSIVVTLNALRARTAPRPGDTA